MTLPTITLSEIKTKEYRLMYKFGAWVTDCKIIAESDSEAIYDCNEIMEHKDSLKNWQYPVALWCGNRIVKAYN